MFTLRQAQCERSYCWLLRQLLRTARVFLLCLAASGLAACATGFPDKGRQIALTSRTPFFIDDLKRVDAGPGQRITGRLIFPDASRYSPPYPAVVLLHTASGRTVHEWNYAKIFLDEGVAVLALDSFSPRGVKRTSKDESKITEATVMTDAYAALHYLSRREEIDAARIGIMGSSKGGAPAIFTAMQRIRDRLARPGQQFAVHIAYYPWCAVELLDMRTTGAPVMIHVGEKDTVTSAAACRTLAKKIRADDPDADIRLSIYKDAYHAFDHPYVGNPLLNRWSRGFPIPTKCYFREVEPGRFVETHSGLPMKPGNLSRALEACSTESALVVGNKDAAQEATARTRALIRETLWPARFSGYHDGKTESSSGEVGDDTTQAPGTQKRQE